VRVLALRLAAFATAIAAGYHAAALSVPAFAAITYPPDYPAIRHVVFIVIDGTVAWLLLRRPWWLVWAYAVLTIQVLNGHGRAAWLAWRRAEGVHVVDVCVSLGVVATLLLLIAERRQRPDHV
jgi:hypothetical protein